jgi:hypothetical protein
MALGVIPSVHYDARTAAALIRIGSSDNHRFLSAALFYRQGICGMVAGESATATCVFDGDRPALMLLVIDMSLSSIAGRVGCVQCTRMAASLEAWAAQ